MLRLSMTTCATPHTGQPMPQQTFGATHFLLPVQKCEFQLTGILEALTCDPSQLPMTSALYVALVWLLV
ncbi:hypothetical protein BDR06DRAFT_1068327 [Suillus hirtellus]|nr:hypothetical protein BDR06DRAFT_1068327 [Suillus hirtellus]